MQNLNLRKRERQLKKHNEPNIISKFFSYSLIILLTFIGYIAINSAAFPTEDAIANIDKHAVYKQHKHMADIYNQKIDSLQNILIYEVDTYMKSKYAHTRLSAENIVNLCIDYDFDIPLLLSQAQIETAFGKTNKRNSVFGVVNKRFAHPDHSVEHYIKLMKKSYVRTRTPEECLASGFYVEGSTKYKYAANPKYAQTIRGVRSNIIKTTPIQDIHNQIKHIKSKLDDLQLDMLTNQNPS